MEEPANHHLSSLDSKSSSNQGMLWPQKADKITYAMAMVKKKLSNAYMYSDTQTGRNNCSVPPK